MDRREHLIQQWHDGRLGSAEAAAVARMVADDPLLQAQADALAQLDAGLKDLGQAQRASDPQELAARIALRLPNRPPVTAIRFSVLDLILATVVVVLGVGTYALAGVTLSHSSSLIWIAIISVTLGLCLVSLPQLFRQVEAGLLETVLRRPVVATRTDALLCRCIGFVIAGGGLWLLA